MKWTAERIAELRRIADANYTSKEAAVHFGIAQGAVKNQAAKLGISFHGRARLVMQRHEDAQQALWRDLIGPMKERLRAEVREIMAS